MGVIFYLPTWKLAIVIKGNLKKINGMFPEE